MGSVDGKVALVTGAASGIGRATAVALAREGAAAVVVADLPGADGAAAVAAVQEAGAAAAFVPTDVTDADAVGALVQITVDRFGALDAAVNNAGTTGAGGSVVEYPLAEWRRVLDVNLTSVLLCLQAELRVMLGAGRGAIVNVASGAGLTGFAGLPAYVASKHGVVGLTRAAAQECAAAGVRVNAVCPGSTRTPMLEAFMGGDARVERMMVAPIPTGRLGTPDEIAAAIVWLCSDAASFVVGQALPVDGGTLMR